MTSKHFQLIYFFILHSFLGIGQTLKKNKITIIAELSNVSILKTPEFEKISVINLYSGSQDDSIELFSPTFSNGKYIWTIETPHVIRIYNPYLFSLSCLAHPGDSVYITNSNEILKYSGHGAEKFQLQEEIEKAKSSIENPIAGYGKKGSTKLLTIEQYLKLSHYYDEQLDAALSCLNRYKSRLSELDYKWIKCRTIQEVEYDRLSAIGRIPTDKNYFNFSHTKYDVAAAWDTTMYKTHARWFRSQSDIIGLNASYFYYFSRKEVWRKFYFDLNNDTLASKPMRVKMYYKQLVNCYKGLILEQALCYFLNEQVIMEMGAYNPVAHSILQDYYKNSRFPNYKKAIQSLENKHQYLLEKNSEIPFFQLHDEYGSLFTENEIKGKFAIVDFWYSGCEGCKKSTIELQKLQDHFKNDTNVVFLHVSVDKDKKLWLNNKSKGIYTSKGGVHLFTNNLGKGHDMVKDFNIKTFPSVRLIDRYGKILIDDQHPFEAMASSKKLASMINNQLSRFKDGPYVFYENGKTSVYTFFGTSVSEQPLMASIVSATDQENKRLKIDVKKQILIPPAEYSAPNKILVLSDIEGNFYALRKLMQENGVIDTNFNWTFGDGHLIFAGDMFDRGEQVTECLWLIYSLEEKAKSKGGVVHFILGNHEIMNLNGIDSYVREKYKMNYDLLGRSLKQIYNENSELGRWLRSKNIIERIGNLLFCHGGVSPDVNNISLSIEQINSLARPYYDQSSNAAKSDDANLKILFHSRKSPFWYRQYYQADRISKSDNEIVYHATEGQIDSSCKKFNVDHIVTGHTIVADTISVHFNNKIINTDTHHALGKSEALFIENNTYYRVDDKGSRVILFKEKELNISSNVTINN